MLVLAMVSRFARPSAGFRLASSLKESDHIIANDVNPFWIFNYESVPLELDLSQTFGL
jgi:hypothetical protein